MTRQLCIISGSVFSLSFFISDEISSLYQVEEIPTARRQAANAAASRRRIWGAWQPPKAATPCPCCCSASFWGLVREPGAHSSVRYGGSAPLRPAPCAARWRLQGIKCMRLSPGCGSPWPAVAAAPAAGRRPLPGAGRSPARLAPPAVGAAPRFAQGSSRAPCGRPCAPLRCFAPSGRPFPCPGGAPLAAGRPRSLCLGRRPGCGWGAAVPPCPPRCARFAPLRSPRGALAPALAGGLFVALCAPRGKRGFCRRCGGDTGVF